MLEDEGVKILLGLQQGLRIEGIRIFSLSVLEGLKVFFQMPSAKFTHLTEHLSHEFSKRWGERYPQISKSWFSYWDSLYKLANYPEEIRRAIYTANSIESLNNVIRKAIKKTSYSPMMALLER